MHFIHFVATYSIYIAHARTSLNKLNLSNDLLAFTKENKMKEIQRNFNRNEFDSYDKSNKEVCWICKPCRCGFPPEIKWDCEDDKYSKYDKEYYEEKDFNDDNNNYGFGYDKEFCECEKKGKDDKRKQDKNDKNHGQNNPRPCCHCQRKNNCCGFFKIFRC